MTDAADPALGHRPEQPGGPAPGRAAGLARSAGRRAGRPRRRCGPSSQRDARRPAASARPPARPPTRAFDNELLAPAIARYDAARTALAAAAADGAPSGRPHAELHRGRGGDPRADRPRQLRPTWDAVWHGLDLLRRAAGGRAASPTGGPRDRWSYTGHRDRVRGGRAAAAAAGRRGDRRAASWPPGRRQQARLEAQEALDDPLVMAGRRLAGEAFAGEVTEVVMAYSEGEAPEPAPAGHRPHGRPPAPGRAGEGVPRAARRQAADRRSSSGYADPDESRGAEGALVAAADRRHGPGQGARSRVGAGAGRPGVLTLFEHAPRGGAELPDAGGHPVDPRRPAATRRRAGRPIR